MSSSTIEFSFFFQKGWWVEMSSFETRADHRSRADRAAGEAHFGRQSSGTLRRRPTWLSTCTIKTMTGLSPSEIFWTFRKRWQTNRLQKRELFKGKNHITSFFFLGWSSFQDEWWQSWWQTDPWRISRIHAPTCKATIRHDWPFFCSCFHTNCTTILNLSTSPRSHSKTRLTIYSELWQKYMYSYDDIHKKTLLLHKYTKYFLPFIKKYFLLSKKNIRSTLTTN